jgi:hypothetical protein
MALSKWWKRSSHLLLPIPRTSIFGSPFPFHSPPSLTLIPPPPPFVLLLQCTTPDGRNALFYAVWNGHSALLRYLLDNGLHDLINVLNTNQESPLYFACTNGHPDCVSLLLRSGAEIQQDKITEEIVCSTPILPPESLPVSDLLECKRREILGLLGREWAVS